MQEKDEQQDKFCSFKECFYKEKDQKMLMEKLDVISNGLAYAGTYVKHLEKLDCLDDIKNHLMDSATGRNQIETKTAVMIFKVLGLVIAALILCIMFLLTGQHFGLLDIVGGGK